MAPVAESITSVPSDPISSKVRMQIPSLYDIKYPLSIKVENGEP